MCCVFLGGIQENACCAEHTLKLLAGGGGAHSGAFTGKAGQRGNPGSAARAPDLWEVTKGVCVETGLPALLCHEPEGQAHFPAPSSNVKVSTDQRHRTRQHRLPAEPRQPQSSSSGRGAEMLRQRQPRVYAPTGQPSFQGPCEHTGALPTLRTSLHCLGGQKAASGEQCRIHVTCIHMQPKKDSHTCVKIKGSRHHFSSHVQLFK